MSVQNNVIHVTSKRCCVFNDLWDIKHRATDEIVATNQHFYPFALHKQYATKINMSGFQEKINKRDQIEKTITIWKQLPEKHFTQERNNI